MPINLEAEAERLAKLCTSEGSWNCPRPAFGQVCPNVFCDDVEPEHWFEILKREADMMLIDGKAHAEQQNKLLKSAIQKKAKNRAPKLVIISVGDNPASKVYMRNKAKACEEVGIECELVHFNAGIKQTVLVEEIKYQNIRGDVDGIIVQLPLPEGYQTETIINQIAPQKDVDCLTEANLGKLFNVNLLTRMPCTPNAVLDLLWENNIPVTGKHVVILGRSNLVGKPLAVIMSSRFVDATVTLCHSQTENLADICRTADILISAVGKPRFVTSDMVKPGAVVIDVAINRDENGKLCGDVDFDNVAPLTSAITPVPGGVGPNTVSCLLWNTYKANYCGATMFDAIGKGHLILHSEERMQYKLVFCNGDGSEAIIPADLLPESLRDGRQMVDAVETVKHLVQRIRELERQRGLMADGLELYCNYVHREDGECPFRIECPKGGLCTGEVTDKMWIEFFEREAAKEAGSD